MEGGRWRIEGGEEECGGGAGVERGPVFGGVPSPRSRVSSLVTLAGSLTLFLPPSTLHPRILPPSSYQASHSLLNPQRKSPPPLKKYPPFALFKSDRKLTSILFPCK